MSVKGIYLWNSVLAFKQGPSDRVLMMFVDAINLVNDINLYIVNLFQRTCNHFVNLLEYNPTCVISLEEGCKQETLEC